MIEPPLAVAGECIRQNGPSRAAAVSVAPFWPLFNRQTSVEKPITSENSTASLWLSFVAWPIRLRASRPSSNSSSVSRTSRAKACMCRTKDAITSLRRAFGVRDIASSTTGVTAS